MLRSDIPVAVCSRTFSKNSELRERLEEKFSDVRFNDEGVKLSGESLVQFLKGRKGAIIALEPVNDQVLSEVSELSVVAKYGVGLDGIDQEALKKHGVALGWTGGVNRRSVSELALSMILNLIRKVSYHANSVRRGEWANAHGSQLSGKTVGIIGCGHIGKDLTDLLKPFGCRVLLNDLLDVQSFADKNGALVVEKEQLFREADVISLHLPYTEQTHHLINRETLTKMKSNAVLVNTSRGNVVDERALAEALKDGEIFAAALDVFAEEPPQKVEMFDHPHFLGTPHNGGSSIEGVLNMGQSAIDHLYRLLVEEKR